MTTCQWVKNDGSQYINIIGDSKKMWTTMCFSFHVISKSFVVTMVYLKFATIWTFFGDRGQAIHRSSLSCVLSCSDCLDQKWVFQLQPPKRMNPKTKNQYLRNRVHQHQTSRATANVERRLVALHQHLQLGCQHLQLG